MRTAATPRGRDAVASRKALLEAATALFSERGYEHTTLRDIGRSAGVDAALVARYFGSKAALYIEAVAADRAVDAAPGDRADVASVAAWFVGHIDRTGPGPILQALVRSDSAPDIRAAASERLYRRLVQPIEERLATGGAPDARLRAEVVVAALVGVALGRSLGSFAALADAGRDELVALLAEVLGT